MKKESEEAGSKCKDSECGWNSKEATHLEQKTGECLREGCREVIFNYTPMNPFQRKESQFPFAEVSQHEPMLSLCQETGGHSEAWHSDTDSVL